MHPTQEPPLSRNSICSCGRLRTPIMNSTSKKCTKSCGSGFLYDSSDGDVPKSPSLRFANYLGCKSTPKNLDLRKFIHQNVFIDSYYPTVLTDKSQNSSDSAFYLTKSNDSEEEFQAIHKIRHSSFTNSKLTKPGHFYLSSKSRTTIDSKTYTIYSQISDRNAVYDTGSRGDYIGSKSRYFMEYPPDTYREPQNSSHSPESDPVICLHKRVEILEGLLQDALVNSTQVKRLKTRNRQIKNKKKINWRIGEEISSESEEIRSIGNSDTENELLVIRKRLRALERKLERGRSTDVTSNRESSSKNTSGTTEKASGEQRCDESSGTENFKNSSELDHFSDCSLSSSQENRKQCRGKSFSKKHKVKKNFISKCKILKKKTKKISQPESHPSSSDILYKCSEVTKKGRTYCCYSFPPEKTIKDSLTKIVYVRCQNNEEPEIKPRKRRSSKKQTTIKDLCKKNSNTNLLVMASQEDQTKITELFLNDRSRKSRSENFDYNIQEKFSEKKELNACKKSDTNAQEAEAMKTQVGDNKVWQTNLKGNSRTWAACPMCAPPPNGCCPKIVTTPNVKNPEKAKLYRNPLDILKRGGKIKIPVLFEELCRVPKEKRLRQKTSNISMRLVLIRQDSKNPINSLKKFIQKLS